MEFARQHKERIIEAYLTENKSTYEIAKELGTYPNKIRNALAFLGVPRRSYSDAQKSALQTGQAKHPTKGKHFTEEQRKVLSEARAKAWQNISDEERQRLSNISKAKWEAMSDEEKYELRRMAAEAVREASKTGSKTEKYVQKGLNDAGYQVVFHSHDLIPNNQLEVDLFLPELRTAIEIDGPAHFLPIWGEEKLQKHILADAIKSGLLIKNGYVLIRVKQIDKTLSLKRKEDVLNAILEQVRKIEESFPEETNRLIEIEVKDGTVR